MKRNPLKITLVICIPTFIGLFIWNLISAGIQERFTAISGWVSFLATAFVGLITILQAKYYNESAQRNYYYEVFHDYYRKLEEQSRPLFDFNYSWANVELMRLHTNPIRDDNHFSEAVNYNQTAHRVSEFSWFLLKDFLHFEGKENLYDATSTYEKLFCQTITTEMYNGLIGKPDSIEEWAKKDNALKESYMRFVEEYTKYSSVVQLYASKILDGSLGINEIKDKYNSMFDLHLAWLAKNKCDVK